MSRTILITGGAGFIGSHLAEEALEAGDRVVVVDNLITGRRENVPAGAEFLEKDISDPDMEEVLAERGVTVVSHHAAQANVRHSAQDPVFDAQANIVGSLALLQACRRVGVRKVFFASSGGTVYGEPHELPCGEEHPTRPLSPYGCAKLAVEQYLMAYARLGDLDPVIVRYANVYGARQDPRGEAGIVAIFAEKLLAGEPPIIFGDGSQTRDYIHVSDISIAHRRAIEGWEPGIYNLGTGAETPLLRLLEMVQMRLGVDVTPLLDKGNPFELQRNCLSPEKFRSVFGAWPTCALDKGLEKTLPYYVGRREER